MGGVSCCSSRDAPDATTIKAVWNPINKDEDGCVGKDDFGIAYNANANLRQLCSDAGLETDHGFIFEQLDLDDDDKLTYDEFRASTSAIGHLHDVFNGMDANKSGTVSKKEFAAEMAKNPSLTAMCGIAGLSLDFFLKEQLNNEDGKLTWTSFRDQFTAQASLLKLFDGIDKNKSGSISKNELAAGMKKKPKLIKKLANAGVNTDMFVKEQITDGNKKLDFKTFYLTLVRQ